MDNELKILLAIAVVIVVYLFWNSQNTKIDAKEQENFKSSTLPWDVNQESMNTSYLLDDGADGTLGLQYNMCSPSCCSSQYPVPFALPSDPAICGEQEYVPTNFTCMSGDQNAGCMCLSKEQADFLGSRGGNA